MMDLHRAVEELAGLVAAENTARSTLAESLHPLATQFTLVPGAEFALPTASDCLTYIYSGSTKLVVHPSAVDEQVLDFHFAGDLVVVPSRGTHAHSFCALVPSELVLFRMEDVLPAFHHDPQAISGLIDRTISALRGSRDAAILLSRRAAGERVAGFLVSLVTRLRALPSENGILVLPMTRREIGEALGLTIETVSREFSRLRSQGVIETHGRAGLRVLDEGELAARAGIFAAAT